jgi:tetratricopeptide (TPR) repeat protein
MIKKNFHITATLLLLFFSAIFVTAQQNNLAEKDLIKQANKLFEQDEWEKALPLFAQLVSVYPDKPDYNYKLGVCTLMGDRSDRKRPIRYLRSAYSAMASNSDVLFYLGLAYYQNQEYDNAIQYFQMYQAKTDPDSPESKKTFNLLNACQNGSKLSDKNLIADIIFKNEFQWSNYHRAYPVEEMNGALIQKPQQFISSKEAEASQNLFVYISEVKGILYYSGFDALSNNRDIFSVTYDDEGNWGEPIKVKGGVNSYYDEDYPVIADQGMTLYFCSKGHNSMGDYDIFKSTLDTLTGRFGEPENLGNGINSPFDDILFIPDKTGEYAFFASNRDNLHDGIYVYKIRLMKEQDLKAKMLAAQLKDDKNSEPEVFDSQSSKPFTVINQDEKHEQELAMERTMVQPHENNTEKPNFNESAAIARVGSNPDANNSQEKQIKIYNPVKPVKSSEEVSSLAAMNEPLEINLEANDDPNTEHGISDPKAEQIQPDKTILAATPVAPVKYKGDTKDLNTMNETLEINLNTENNSKVVAEITIPPVTEQKAPDKMIVAADQVEQVQSHEHDLAMSEIDETLEIQSDLDQDYGTKSGDLNGIDHPTDQTYSDKTVVADNTIQPVQYDQDAIAQSDMDENLEIRSDTEDKTVAVAKPVEQVYPNKQTSGINIPDDPIHITLVDYKTKQSIQGTTENPQLSANVKKKFIESLRIRAYEESIEYTSITCSNTDKTHAELIRAARSNPDNLSYEELLMAADLIPSPFEKLNLYRAAFIHIDRDWRAYYNASQVAKEIVQMDEALVYQYQASLISDQEMVMLDIETFLWNLFSELNLLTYTE